MGRRRNSGSRELFEEKRPQGPRPQRGGQEGTVSFRFIAFPPNGHGEKTSVRKKGGEQRRGQRKKKKGYKTGPARRACPKKKKFGNSRGGSNAQNGLSSGKKKIETPDAP